MVPNHAVMVMAWAHAPDNFARAISICATAGWDTDCNVANVGCLMGIRGGLAGLKADGHDWQGPFADRVVIPTAEGSHGISDALREADMVARMGRGVMGWRAAPPAKKGAKFHFSQPGALHGFMTEDPARAVVENAEGPRGVRCMRIAHKGVSAGNPARVSTPTYLTPDWLGRPGQGYAAGVPPILYSGQRLSAAVSAAGDNCGPASVALFVRHYTAMGKDVQTAELAGPATSLAPGADGALEWTVPDTGGRPIAQVGIAVLDGGSGSVSVDRLTWGGSPAIRFPPGVYRPGHVYPYGWRPSAAVAACMRQRDTCVELVSNRERTLLATGTADWRDYRVSASVTVHLADTAGVAARYGGLLRYVSFEFDPKARELRLVRHLDGARRVLASAPCGWGLDEPHEMALEVRGSRAVAHADGRKALEAGFRGLAAGGVALFVSIGKAEFGDVAVMP
jgi:hypothetical protein